MFNNNDSALIVTLTIGELKGLIIELLREQNNNGPVNPANPSGNLVYGIRGIEKLFNVSHKTAQDYKNTFLKPAVMQCGRKIVVDADLALKLFNERREK